MNPQRSLTWKSATTFPLILRQQQQQQQRQQLWMPSSHPGTIQRCPQVVQQRSFSSRRNNKNNSSNKKEAGPLANEHLIKVLMQKHKAAGIGPEKVEVRLVIDEGPQAPATVQVCSVADAISISLDRMTDLIGTSLDTTPPVIRATQLSKLHYRKEQAASKNRQPTKQQKSFRFKAGIGDHDLERKIADMHKTLQKGMECEFTVFSKAKIRRLNANAGMELVQKIQALVANDGTLKRPPQLNDEGSFVRVQLEPIRKS
jgi:translation initiation factor IF-3